VLAGNHEHAMMSGDPPLKDEVYQLSVVKSALAPADIEYVRSLPSSVARNETLFVHGSPSDPVNGYLYPDTELDEVSYRFVFCGHTHRPFIRQAGHTTYVNVGSCGLPRDDGRYGACAILDGFKAEIVRFSIEQETAASLAECDGAVHDAVLQVFQRRADSLVGRHHG
jgi:diadenosine tetraphosphatase ApaH/serine/threonine PP2A family protein phosphatase